jgi:hypothetical protein
MKKVKIILFVLVCLATSLLSAGQQVKVEAKNKKGFLYFGFGSNLSFYTPSDIHVRSSGTPSYDFTLYNVRAKDDGGIKFNNGGAPQYTYQIGYYFSNKKFGVEFNFDHVKYFVTPNQVVRLKGTIDNKQYDTDTSLTADFFKFEHSDGANYALFSFVKLFTLSQSKNGKNTLDLITKAGIGPVIPKTNSTIMGRHYDDQYKVSGYVVALEGGLRYNFLKNFYIAPTLKGAYANYNRFLVADGTGNQKWMGLHFMLVVGGQLNFK